LQRAWWRRGGYARISTVYFSYNYSGQGHVRSPDPAVRDRAEAHGTARGFPPLELRFALEYSAPPDFAAERSAIAQLLESEEFTLQPLFAGDEPELARILLLRFPGIERTLSPETLFSIAYDLADARALVRAEPDLGSLIFADPPPLTDELRPEAADALGALCWVDADTPADKRWALETIGVLRAWARYPSRGRGGFCPEGNAGSRARCARAARKLTQR
jgi:hypothetical protein